MDKEILVNKENRLDRLYIPSDMIKIYEPTLEKLDPLYINMLVKEAYIYFKYMQMDAFDLGYQIFIDSSYRSYDYQERIYNDYLNKYGIDYVNKYVALPGTSEHQSGLAIDISYKRDNLFVSCNEEDEEIKWLKSNSYKYGYILRYPKGKESITGYNYEMWHYRYVGHKLADYLYNNELVLEEKELKLLRK